MNRQRGKTLMHENSSHGLYPDGGKCVSPSSAEEASKMFSMSKVLKDINPREKSIHFLACFNAYQLTQ